MLDDDDDDDDDDRVPAQAKCLYPVMARSHQNSIGWPSDRDTMQPPSDTMQTFTPIGWPSDSHRIERAIFGAF